MQAALEFEWHFDDGRLAFATGRGRVGLRRGQPRLADAVADIRVAAQEQVARSGRLCSG